MVLLLTLTACDSPGLLGFYVGFSGTVVDRGGAPIEGATLTLGTADGSEIGTATTDADGAWAYPVYGSTLDGNVLVGVIRADGYADGKATWEVNLQSPTIDTLEAAPGETWVTVDRRLAAVTLAPEAAEGSTAGRLVDAATGGPAAGVPLTLQYGWNASVGEPAVGSTTTDGEGNFSFSADEPGMYTVFATSTSSWDVSRFPAFLDADGGWTHGAVTAPTDPGQLVATLLWSGSPTDLDLHLKAPVVGGSGTYHVWSGDPIEPDNPQADELEAEMVRSDADGNGPETIEMFRSAGEGEVRLTIVDNDDLSDAAGTALSTSEATLLVWNGEDTPRFFTVAPGEPAVAWHPVTIASSSATVYALEEYATDIDPADDSAF